MKSVSFTTTLPVVMCVLGYTSPVYAYLDPGTGSIIIQGVIATVVGAGVAMKIYWHKIRKFFSPSRNTDNGGSNEKEGR